MITVSNSRLACYRRCLRKYRYRYVDQLEAVNKSPALVLGSLVHESLAEFYHMNNKELDCAARAEKAMKLYDDAVAAKADEVLSAGGDSERFDKDSYMGRQMLRYYYEEIAPKDDFTPVASEVSVDVRIPNLRGKSSWCRFIGFVDGIVERDGRLYILEHKTAKALDTKHLVNDTQVTQYIWALRQLGYDVCGVYYNILRKCDPYSARTNPPYHYREAVYRNDDELDTAARNMYLQYKAMRRAEDTGYYPNPTRDCSWDCEFRSLCIAESEGDLPSEEFVQLAESQGFTVKDPYVRDKDKLNTMDNVMKGVSNG